MPDPHSPELPGHGTCWSCPIHMVWADALDWAQPIPIPIPISLPHGAAWCSELEPPWWPSASEQLLHSALVTEDEGFAPGCSYRWLLLPLSPPWIPLLFANTSLQDYSHSRAMCPFVQHVTTFLKKAPLRINEQIYLQNIENAKENMTSTIQGAGPNQISSSWK